MIKKIITIDFIKGQWFRQGVKIVLDAQMGVLAWLIILELIPGIQFNSYDMIVWISIISTYPFL